MKNHEDALKGIRACRNIVFCLCALMLVGGCAPLKKKFTRKKKKEKEESQKFIPVLEPIDYPEKTVSIESKYKYHYSLWKVWDKDLLQAIERNGSNKRQSYLLNQVLNELEEMGVLLASEKKAELSEIIGDLRDLQQEYDRPEVMRNTFSIKKRLSSNAKKIRNGFSPAPSLPYQQ